MSLKEISPDSVCKGSVKGSYEEDEEFEDDNTPLADLVRMMALARRTIAFQSELTVDDFI